MNLEDLEKKRIEFNEHNDCSVKSVAVSCGVSYEKAHAALKEAGRRNRGRCYFNDHCKPAIESLGFEVVEEKFPGKTLVTLEKDLRRYARGRKFFVKVREHFVGFDGEKFVDWAQGRRNRVKGVYRVKRVVTDNRTLVDCEPADDWTPEELPRGEYPIDTGKVPNWLRNMPRPSGAPKKGTRVVQTLDNNETFEGDVVDFLASQFIIEMDGGRERIVAVGDDWKEL
jgi:hypothetical protein